MLKNGIEGMFSFFIQNVIMIDSTIWLYFEIIEVILTVRIVKREIIYLSGIAKSYIIDQLIIQNLSYEI